jgi:hypothetical protein
MNATEVTRKNRITGTRLSGWNEGGVWVVNCDDHDQCCEFDSKRAAIRFSAAPHNFCTTCYAVAAAKVGN